MLIRGNGWKVWVLAVVVAAAAPNLGWAQGGGRGGAGGGRGGFGGGGFGGGFGGMGGFGGNELMLLQSEGIRDELGLVDDQVEKLRSLMEKQREEMRTVFSGLNPRGGENETDEQRQARFDEIRQKIQERTADIQKDVDSILLPHQAKRIKQISRQMRLRARGGDINADALAEELKLTDEQREKLRQKALEVQKKLQEKVAKLRKEAEDDLLSVLSVEQRAEYKDMIGDAFDTQRAFAGPGGLFGAPGGGGPGGGNQGGGGGRGGRVGRGGQNN